MSGLIDALRSYSYLAPTGSHVTQLVWDPSPVAWPGTLAAGHTPTLTLTAQDTAGNPVAGAAVYLQLTPAPGSGATITITTPGCTSVLHHPALHKCTADHTGQITVDYKPPPAPPPAPTPSASPPRSPQPPPLPHLDLGYK